MIYCRFYDVLYYSETADIKGFVTSYAIKKHLAFVKGQMCQIKDIAVSNSCCLYSVYIGKQGGRLSRMPSPHQPLRYPQEISSIF